MARPDHISASQLTMFNRCAMQWYFRYAEGKRIPPGVALIRGKSVHEAREMNLRQKVETGDDLPAEEVEAAARDAVVAQFTGQVQLDSGQSPRRAKADCIDGAVRLARCDYECFQRSMQPRYVERRVTIHIPGLGLDIVGVLDTSDAAEVVRDLKTRSKTPSPREADRSDQLTTYALMYRTIEGRLPKAVQLDAVVDLKAGPQAVPLPSTRTVEELDVLVRRYYAAIRAIEKGAFVPCPADSWVCQPKWCGYTDICPYYARGESRPVD